MDSGRLSWLAIWTRISCDAILIVGGTLMAYGALVASSHSWFIAYGVLAVAVAMLTACSRKRRTRRRVMFLLLVILLYVVAIALVAATRGGIDRSVLIALGFLAAWPFSSIDGPQAVSIARLRLRRQKKPIAQVGENPSRELRLVLHSHSTCLPAATTALRCFLRYLPKSKVSRGLRRQGPSQGRKWWKRATRHSRATTSLSITTK